MVVGGCRSFLLLVTTIKMQYTEFQNQSVKINNEDKHMYASFLTNSTLLIHRI